MSNVKSALEGPLGFTTSLQLKPEELAMVRGHIRAQWLDRITAASPVSGGRFANLPMDRYHEACHLVDHSSLWPKTRRILGPDAVEQIRHTSLIRALEEEFGPFAISDEEGVGHEEMYWRLVRPDGASDVGPMHADAWFWALGHGLTPPGHQRVKVWIAIHCDPGRNGFRFVPGSHKRDWRYHGAERDGFVKPQIDESETDLDVHLFDSAPGQAIVFHDRLLHGGAVGGSSTRVSLEFTIFVPNHSYFS